MPLKIIEKSEKGTTLLTSWQREAFPVSEFDFTQEFYLISMPPSYTGRRLTSAIFTGSSADNIRRTVRVQHPVNNTRP